MGKENNNGGISLNFRLARIVYPWVGSFFVFFILLEVSLYVFTRYIDLPINIPSYLSPSTNTFHSDINKDFGVWHKPNSSYQHQKTCFNVKYTSNQFGARDQERKIATTNERVVVLGDSFIEGFGVEKEFRLTDLLESSTGIEHLNFGTSGNFGTIQQSILYKSLAIRFKHNYVLIGFLPNNDFKDDDLSFGMRVYSKRYRPYYKGSYPNYKVIYFKSDFNSTTSITHSLKAYLRNYTFSYNVASYFKRLFIYKRQQGAENYSGYFDYTPEELLRTRYSIKSIVDTANSHNKKVFLFTIPVKNDFTRAGNENEAPPLYLDFKKMSKEIGFEYIDLLPYMMNEIDEEKSFFHTCDGHWNAYGNKVASKILLNKLPFYD